MSERGDPDRPLQDTRLSLSYLPAEQLREREKELACLYKLARVLTAIHPVKETAATVVASVRRALLDPDTSRVRVCFGDVEARSDGYDTPKAPTDPAGYYYRAPIVTGDRETGAVEVSCTTALLDHERAMLDAVAVLLANNLERRRVEDELRDAVSAENRKAIALEELLAQVQEIRRRNMADLREQLDTDVHPIIGHLKAHLREPATLALLDALRRSVDRLCSRETGHLHALRTRLSPREQEIAQLIASGMPTKQIAEALDITGSTVERHRNNIRRKLGIQRKGTNLATFLRSAEDE